MFEFFRSLFATIRTIFEPRFVGRFHDSYKGPRSWWIHVNPNKYKHVYLFYVSRFVRDEWYRGFNTSARDQAVTIRDLEQAFRKEVADLLDGCGAEWMTVPWTPMTASEDNVIWVVAMSNDDWLMHARLHNSRLGEVMFYDHDRI